MPKRPQSERLGKAPPYLSIYARNSRWIIKTSRIEAVDSGKVHALLVRDRMLDEAGRPIELDRGAMGITRLDVDLRCPVTLKVIRKRYLGNESAQFRFLREAQRAAGQFL